MRKYYKIPEEIKSKIIEGYKSGLQYQEIADKYEISKQSISKIINNNVKVKGYHQKK